MNINHPQRARKNVLQREKKGKQRTKEVNRDKQRPPNYGQTVQACCSKGVSHQLAFGRYSGKRETFITEKWELG